MQGKSRLDPADAREPEISRSSKLAAYVRTPVFHLQLLIVFAVFLGGGGAAYGLRNLFIQLAALAVLAVNAPHVTRFLREGPRLLVLLAGLTLAVPLLQLIPLPPAIWQSLPGRELVTETYDIAGLDPQSWLPVSLNPMRTLVAFCATLVPAIIIAVGTMLPVETKVRLVWTLIGATFAALCLGIVQLSAANTAGLLFDERTTPNVLYATFANRNSTALMFVLALCLIAGLPWPRHKWVLFPMLGIAPLLAVGTILTQSRTGMVLLILPLALAGLRAGSYLFKQRLRSKAGPPRIAVWGGAAAAVMLGLAIAVSAGSGGRAAESFARFADTATDRPEMWEDGLYAAGQYWPAGAGTGAFDDVFQLHESLEYVSPRRAGRAHNDYIELAIENGVAGIVVTLLWLAWAAFNALRPFPAETLWLRLGAGTGVAAISLQSLLDYPLRNMTLLSFLGVLVLVLSDRSRLKT